MSTLVEVQDLKKSFAEGDTETRVLKGLKLKLASGDLAALLGPSGSGKSTLLSILGTLMKPTSGKHVMLGRDLAKVDDVELNEFRNSHIGFIFQFHHLLPDLTALENVIFPNAIKQGRETKESRKRGIILLERVGLAHRMNFRAAALSGGQKQRVAIARALMNSPELVLADEPTGNLDSESAKRVMNLIHEINTEEHTTFLISTHDEKIAAACRSRINVVDGQIVMDNWAALE